MLFVPPHVVRGWRPDRDPNVRLMRWYQADARENQLSGSQVISWTDLSAQRAHLNTTAGGNYPTQVEGAAPNGRTVVRFNGTTQSLLNQSPLLYANAFTIFWAGNATATANGRFIVEGSGASSTPLFTPMTMDGTGTKHHATARNDASTIYFNADLGASTVSGAANILAVTDDLTTMTGYLNRTAQSSLTSTRSGTTTLDNFTVGAWNSGGTTSQPMAQDVFEIIIVAGALSPSSSYFQRAHDYLKSGWKTA